jgi:hypothetical protein
MTMDGQSITSDSIKRLLVHVYRRFKDGLIDAEQAKQETLLLNSCLEAVTHAETIARLSSLRDILKETE